MNDKSPTQRPSVLGIVLPPSLDAQLREFRTKLRRMKMLESAGIALFGVLVGFLAVFLVDRLIETPGWVRWLIFLGAGLSIATLPLWFERWVLRYTSHASLARLMSQKFPAMGDSLLSAIELSSNANEQSRSPALCRAALEQVAAEAATKDLSQAAPDAFHRRWWVMAALAGVTTMLVAGLYPSAAWNAWNRFAMPWKTIDRYTFAMLGDLPRRWVVPHGETLELNVPLAEQTAWQPKAGKLWLSNLPAIESQLSQGGYRFELPPQIQPSRLQLLIGDARPAIEVIPTLRPEILTATANITLPEYLQRTESLEKDIRSGSLTIVEGASIALTGQATRALTSATLDGQSIAIRGDTFQSPSLSDRERTDHEVRWIDEHGLSAKAPFQLQVNVLPDEEPTVFAEGLPRSKVLLDSEQLKFQVRTNDDFGIRQIGMEWRTATGVQSGTPTQGEWVLTAGSPTTDRLDAEAIFQATALKIEPQPIELRVFVEDYLPGRSRVYSAPHLMYVLNASDHAMWVLQQFSRWQREALEVRDRELQLLEVNKKLRSMSPEDLAREETKTLIEQQAAAEQANARRLGGLTSRGDELLKQAARNSEIGVGHLEKWAEMQKILKDISANRMPSVANLLKQAAKNAKPSAAGPPASDPKIAGSNKNDADSASAANSQDPNDPNAKPAAPRVIDAESSQQPIDPVAASDAKKKSGAGALRLPTTTVVGAAPKKKAGEETPPAPNAVDEAVEQQMALLEEFDKVSEELNKIMANLEGSTLVKRFKAAAREQIQVADAAGATLPSAFGTRTKKLSKEDRQTLDQLAAREGTALNSVGQIIDDLESFHERRPMVKFRDVIDDIKKEDPMAGLRKLSQQVAETQGLAIAEAEYWSDTFDRWAEDLVDPACKGQCPGSKSKSSLPPSIVLEVMQILEAEMNLRDRTRVAEQSRAASTDEQYSAAVDELGTTQSALRERIIQVGEKIEELPNASEEFAKEIQLMHQVEVVMNDAVSILSRPETGRPAIAAETEAIELLLASKRINPKGGGGGGANPGGGGSGDTTDAAIAMVGPGVNEKEARQDHGIEQATGTTGSGLPEEFRHGLDQYFDRLDRRRAP
jgi:hypothetical protein